jgi:starch synthase
MKIAIIASEVFPYAKTGGLADVTGTLPKILSRAGLDIAVFMPFYREVKSRNLTLIKVLDAHPMAWKDGQIRFSVWADPTTPFPVCFIEHDGYFDRERLYGDAAGDYADNGERFAFFSKAAVEALKALPFEADIVHAHDWQSGAALAYLRHVYAGDVFYAGMRSLFTIHNLAYQGLFPASILSTVGLPERLFRMEDMEFWGQVGYLKAGILYASAINTVSPRYSREIQTPEFGCGLEGLLHARRDVLSGIRNGIDESEWNPATDSRLAATYSPADTAGKAVCKRELLDVFGLTASPRNMPVVGMVSRLAGQKGFDILIEALGGLFAQGFKIVILGSGESTVENALRSAGERFPSFLGLRIGFDETLARKIFAGSDLVLIPSRYEPCGLTQMIGLRYGTIPIVRATGGLDDTVQEFDPVEGQGTGFKFAQHSPQALVEAARRAAGIYSRKLLWNRLVGNALAADFSWAGPAAAYTNLYEQILR